MVKQVPQLLSELGMAISCCLGSHLDRDRVETFIVAICVAPNERF